MLLAQAAGGFPDWASLGVGVAACAVLAYIVPKMLGALSEQRAAYRELLQQERETNAKQQARQNEAVTKLADAVERLTDRMDGLMNGSRR